MNFVKFLKTPFFYRTPLEAALELLKSSLFFLAKFPALFFLIVQFMLSLYIKNDSTWDFFFTFQLTTKAHHKLHLQLKYTWYKFALFSRRKTLRYRGLSGIDFMHINHNEYRVISLTTCKHNTTTTWDLPH